MPSRGRRGALAALLLALAALPPLAACAADRYMGLPLAVGAADPERQALARRAQAGDKHAQLELGIRYEEGRGVRIDLERAELLYAAAARPGRQLMHIYSPPVGRERTGRVIAVNTGVPSPGLIEAADRLAALSRARTATPQ